MRTLFVSGILLLATFAAAQSQSQLNLMPMPASVQPGSGHLLLTRSFSVSVTGSHDASLDKGVQRFVAQLARQTGMFLREKPAGPATLTIHADHGREAIQKLGEDESYELDVTDAGAKLTAPTTLGVLRGLQTFLQLEQTTADGFAVPAVTIKDQPRFPWRGLMIDSSRHFMPVEVIERNLDGMASVKMNVLHWHLSDDQGFRAESKKLPKLTGMGSEGLFYTQEQLSEIIAYAYDRGIRVVPEFDTPGHSTSWFVGYPELASGSGAYGFALGGPESVTDPTKETTYKFLDKFVEEMGKLFPDAYFHIGGDEVNGKYWDANPEIQAFIHAHGMKNNQDLQAYFNQRLQKILTKHHKIMIGWDEILHPDLPKTITVQSWRGQESLATAAKQGYSGLLSFGYYLDLMFPAAKHYAVDPMSGGAATLTAEESRRILGGESCMWAEWVTPENIDSRIWPRNAAVAERLWSPQNVQDVDSMYARLWEVSRWLEWVGLTHRTARYPMLRRLAGSDDITALRTLSDVVEGVKDYTRWDDSKGPIDFHMPLNHLVDATSPESEPAHLFSNLVQSYLKGGMKDRDAEAQIRTMLTMWRDNDAKLRPVIAKSQLLQEVAPHSENLGALGAAGLQALDYLDKSQPAPDAWRTQQLALVEQAKTPKASLLLMVVEPVRQLIEASAGH